MTAATKAKAKKRTKANPAKGETRTKHQDKRIKPTWTVVIRSNLDDVICGGYPSLPLARRRMKAVLKNPYAELSKNNMQTWDVSGIIAVAIFRVQGDKVEFWDQNDFGDDAAEAA